jgi:hypothetical protein
MYFQYAHALTAILDTKDFYFARSDDSFAWKYALMQLVSIFNIGIQWACRSHSFPEITTYFFFAF